MPKILHTVRLSPFWIVTVLVLAKMQLFRVLLFGSVGAERLLADLLSVLIVTSFLELLAPRRIRGLLYAFYLLLVTVCLLGSAVYFRYFGTVPTYTALFGLGQLPQVKSSVESLLSPKELLFVLDLIAIVVGYVFLKLTKRSLLVSVDRVLPKKFLASFIVIGLVYGMVSVRASAETPNELKRAEMLGFSNYQAAAVWNTFLAKNRQVADLTEMPQAVEKVEQLHATQSMTPISPTKGSKDPADGSGAYFGSQKGKNLVFVQMEALQGFPVHLKLDGQTLTPVLNELTGEGFYFPRVFQQIGMGNTSDAEFISNTSIYPTATIAMSTGFGNRDIPSLPKLLKKQGYSSMTLHANTVTFWDRNKMYPALGFDKYFDKPSFKQDDIVGLGASDEELYRVGLEQMKELASQNKPFYAQFVTLSNHHPFKMPKEKEMLKLPDTLKGTQLGSYLQSVRYSDYALGTLVQGLKDAGLWENTVLVVYGDHFGLQAKDNKPEEVSAALGINYHSDLSRLNIPLVIRVPGGEGKTVERVGGQVDILPTVANLLGISLDREKFVHFGHDLLNIQENVVAMRYYLPTGSFFNDEILFIPGEGFEDGKAFSLKTHEPVNDFAKYRKDYDYILKWMKLSDGYVEMLPQRQ